jgi:catechol 2,3-dioxygenase-like lactoylglutathione lyase family enzyme
LGARRLSAADGAELLILQTALMGRSWPRAYAWLDPAPRPRYPLFERTIVETLATMRRCRPGSESLEHPSMNRPALVPELYVSSLDASLSFYVDLLGFRVEYDRPEERFAYLALGSAHLMLEETPALARATPEQVRRGQWRTADLEHPFGRGMNLEIRVSALEATDSRLKQARWARLLELHTRVYRVKGADYAVRQLLIADPDGYLIRLSEPLDPS